jgi:hypothetical protein
VTSSNNPPQGANAAGFKTFQLNLSGWIIVVAAGAMLGFGLMRALELAVPLALVFGIGLVWLALLAFDRRRNRRGTARVMLDLPASEVEQILRRARSERMRVALIRDAGQLGIACRRRDVNKVLRLVQDASE